MIGVDDIVTAVSGVAGKLIDRLWPDPTQAAAAKLELLKMEQTGELAQLASTTDLLKGQLDINKAEAGNSNVFGAGWRPFIGWAGGVGFAVQFALIPLVGYGYSLFGHPAPPELQLNPMLMDILFGILGLNIGVRTYEKTKGVAS